MAHSPLLLLVGFNDYSFKRLESHIKGYGLNISLTNQIAIETINHIVASFINFDTANLDEKLAICREQLPNKPMFGLSDKPVKFDNITILKNPVSDEELLLALKNIGVKKITTQQKAKEIRAVYSSAESPFHYSIKNCFQDHLIKAWKLHLEVKQPVKLIFLNKPVLIIFENKISGLLSKQQLQKLCGLTIQEHSINRQLSVAPKGLETSEATYFIAKIVLWSSHGRLPDGINSTDVFELTEQVQGVTLPKIDDAEMIQQLWAMENCSLQKTEHVLGVSQANLFSYFSVLYALELIDYYHPNRPPTKKNTQSSKQGWLSKKLFSRKKLIPNTF